jgi:hypothetical protein
MERQSLAEASLIEALIQETGRALGRDANFLGVAITIRRRAGEPNWDADCGIVNPIVVKAFAVALNNVQAQFNLD